MAYNNGFSMGYGQTPIFTCNQNQCGCNGGCGCGI